MPVFERAGVSLYYEEYGSGYPLLLFAPGGMRSSIDFWRQQPLRSDRRARAGFPRNRDGPAQRWPLARAD